MARDPRIPYRPDISVASCFSQVIKKPDVNKSQVYKAQTHIKEEYFPDIDNIEKELDAEVKKAGGQDFTKKEGQDADSL